MTKRRVGTSLFRPGVVLLAALVLCGAVRSIAQVQVPMVSGGSSKTPENDAKVPEYEVASVKENKSDNGMVRVMTNADGFTGENLSLQMLIADAYGIKQDLVSGGPGWVGTKGFNVDAKVAGTDIAQLKKITPRQRASMLQPILAERFKLKVHIETKELPIYELEVMKGGAKLKEAAPEPPAAEPDHALPEKDPKDGPPMRGGMMRMRPGELSAQAITIGSLVSQLSYIVHRTVLDKTGLTGKYDFELKWSPEEEAPKQDNGSTDTSPSIFTAVQEQLGLKLQSTKGPVDTLLIDHAELPTEN